MKAVTKKNVETVDHHTLKSFTKQASTKDLMRLYLSLSTTSVKSTKQCQTNFQKVLYRVKPSHRFLGTN